MQRHRTRETCYLLGPIRRNIFRRRDIEHWLIQIWRAGLVGVIVLLAIQPLKAEWHRSTGLMPHCDREGVCR
jgi:hypothetical protein